MAYMLRIGIDEVTAACTEILQRKSPIASTST